RDASRHPACPVGCRSRVLRCGCGAAAGARPLRLSDGRSRQAIRVDRLEVRRGRGQRGNRCGGKGLRERAKAMTAAVSLIILLVVLGSSIAVSAGMGLTGVILNQIYSSMPLTRILGELSWSTTSNFILTAIPFYIMFGEILLRSGIAERMYSSLMQWLSWLPGGLMHSNIGACALFGSVSGSSVATAATIGVVAMGEIDKHK